MAENSSRPGCYRITVHGRVSEALLDAYGNMEIAILQAADGSPISVLSGAVGDQAALRGFLVRLWDQNLDLISVLPAGPDTCAADHAC